MTGMLRIVHVVLLLPFSCFALKKQPAERAATCDKADVGFLLDMSTTISRKTFHRQIKIIKGLVRAFDVKLTGSRAGLVTFSDSATTRIHFDKHPTAYEFNRAMRRIVRKGGRTRIDRGIDQATMVLYGQRYHNKADFNRKKYLFVITDGKQTRIKGRRPNLKRRTRLLRHLRVRIIAIAVGGNPAFYVLNQLVQNPDLEVIHVSNRAKIRSKVDEIHRISCLKQPKVPVYCSKRADMAFLLDQSSSIGGAHNFRFETEFVKGVLDNFNTGENKIRAGVISYGEFAWTDIKLNEFQNFKDIKTAVDQRVRFKGSRRTRIDRALDIANKEFFTEANGDRPDTPNYLILVTDGQQNSGNWTVDNYFTQWFAKPLWKRNITIFAVGVAQADVSQLKNIAGPSGMAIYRKRLENLNEAVDEIIPVECKGCHRKASLMFVLDASGTTRLHFKQMKDLAYYIAEGFRSQRKQLDASVIRFSEIATTDIHFKQYASLINFRAELDTGLPFMGKSTFIHKGLRAAEEEFDKNARKNLPKIMIVMTDGRQTESKTLALVRNAANDLRRKGVKTFVLSASGSCKNPTCKGFLQSIAGDPDNILYWKSSDDMLITSERLARYVCPEPSPVQ